MQHHAPRLIALVPALLWLVIQGCSEKSTPLAPLAPADPVVEPPRPQTTRGAIEVSVEVSGDSADPEVHLAYVHVSGDRGALPQSLPLTGETIRFAELAPGRYWVMLERLAPTCEVAGDNGGFVFVGTGETLQVAFTVVCYEPIDTIAIAGVYEATSLHWSGVLDRYTLFEDGTFLWEFGGGQVGGTYDRHPSARGITLSFFFDDGPLSWSSFASLVGNCLVFPDGDYCRN